MKQYIRNSKKLPYFIVGVLLTIVEVWIALFVHDQLIRPIIGDVLIVFVLYCFWRCMITTKYDVFLVTAFACLVEITQIFPLVDVLGIHQPILRILMGTTFDWFDPLAYALAGGCLCLWEHYHSTLGTK